MDHTHLVDEAMLESVPNLSVLAFIKGIHVVPQTRAEENGILSDARETRAEKPFRDLRWHASVAAHTKCDLHREIRMETKYLGDVHPVDGDGSLFALNQAKQRHHDARFSSAGSMSDER